MFVPLVWPIGASFFLPFYGSFALLAVDFPIWFLQAILDSGTHVIVAVVVVVNVLPSGLSSFRSFERLVLAHVCGNDFGLPRFQSCASAYLD